MYRVTMSFSLRCDLKWKAWYWEEGDPDSRRDSITNLMCDLRAINVSTRKKDLHFLIYKVDE